MNDRPPLLAALTLFATMTVWATGLMIGVTTLDGAVARTAGAGAWLVGVIALVGLLVSRGRWAQRLGVLFAIGSVLPSAFVTSVPFFWTGVALSAVAGVSLLLDPAASWIRPGRSMDAPPDAAVVLMLVLIVWPLLGAPLATDAAGFLVWAGPLLAFWYSRASVSGLWAARVGAAVPLVAALGGSPRDWLVALVLSAATAWFAWQRDTRLAVVPLTKRPSGGVCPTPDFEKLLRGFDDA